MLTTNPFIAPVAAMITNMVEKVEPSLRSLIEGNFKGKMVDFSGGAIKMGHTGKGLLLKMMEACLIQASQSGFNSIFCYGGNVKATFSYEKLQFRKVGEVNAK